MDQPQGQASLLHLPHDWLFWLDVPSLLRVLEVALTVFGPELEERIWQGLVAAELGVDRSLLVLAGPAPSLPQAVGRRAPVCAWRRVFFDLDVASTRSELRHTKEAYESLPSQFGEEAELPRNVSFLPDAADRWVICFLQGRLGRDRCVVSTAPLSALLSATALPRLNGGVSWTPPRDARGYSQQPPAAALRWEVAYRSVSYYEISLGVPVHHSEGELSRHAPCVSVGLCTGGLSRNSVKHKQAGWDEESWAWHGDDGNLFHSSSHGEEFHWMSANSLRRADQPLRRYGRGRPRDPNRPGTTFGQGDTIGCGVMHFLPEPEILLEAQEGGSPSEGLLHPVVVQGSAPLRQSKRGIFFTKNGHFMGLSFVLDGDRVPVDLPLFPCVGIDARWTLDFNFGQVPFLFDVDRAIAPIEVRCPGQLRRLRSMHQYRHDVHRDPAGLLRPPLSSWSFAGYDPDYYPQRVRWLRRPDFAGLEDVPNSGVSVAHGAIFDSDASSASYSSDRTTSSSLPAPRRRPAQRSQSTDDRSPRRPSLRAYRQELEARQLRATSADGRFGQRRRTRSPAQATLVLDVDSSSETL